MAALSITAVRVTADTITSKVLCGSTLAEGVPVYKNASTKKHLAGDCDASAATRSVKGVTVTTGVDDGHALIATAGSIELVGATMSPQDYYLGPTAGQIVPFADLGSGDSIVRIGTAISSTLLKLDISDTGGVKA